MNSGLVSDVKADVKADVTTVERGVAARGHRVMSAIKSYFARIAKAGAALAFSFVGK